jgi:hypothetical protein
METPLVGFGGVVVVGEVGKAGALVIEHAKDGGQGGGDASLPLIFLGQYSLVSAGLVS